MGAPLSTIYICNALSLNSRYEHTIYFDSASAQQEYFMGKVVKTFTHYTYLRPNWSIKVNATMLEAKAWSYLFFKNTPDPKIYYYFITRIDYINENTVELFLEMDVMQTYLFDYTLLPCLVERQHTETDEIGEHTLDEGVDTGELTTQGSMDVSELNDLCILICTSLALPQLSTSDSISNVYGISVDNMFSGLAWFAVKSSNMTKLGLALYKINEAGKTDGIFNMMMFPRALIRIDDNDDWDDDTNGIFKQVLGVQTIYSAYMKPDSLNGYKPKNNKLFCYPYNFLHLSNNQGGGAVYRYERSKGNAVCFDVHGAVGGDVRMTPQDYDGIELNYEEGLSLTGFPNCSWNSDTYKIWLAQNQNAFQLSQIQTGLTIGAGMATSIVGMALMNPAMIAGGAGAAVSGVMQHSAQIAQKEDRKIQPPQARGTHSPSVNTVAGKQTFTYYAKCVTAENAKIIDDFFHRYGYKINRVQQPKTKARADFTYIKTNGCNIRGNINNEATTKICSIFDNGITFWVNGEFIGLYDLAPNAIIGEV